MSKDKDTVVDALARDIKRQIKTEANKRFLRRIPMFEVDEGLPGDLGDLLTKLDSAERVQRWSGGR